MAHTHDPNSRFRPIRMRNGKPYSEDTTIGTVGEDLDNHERRIAELEAGLDLFATHATDTIMKATERILEHHDALLTLNRAIRTLGDAVAALSMRRNPIGKN